MLDKRFGRGGGGSNEVVVVAAATAVGQRCHRNGTRVHRKSSWYLEKVQVSDGEMGG